MNNDKSSRAGRTVAVAVSVAAVLTVVGMLDGCWYVGRIRAAPMPQRPGLRELNRSPNRHESASMPRHYHLPGWWGMSL